MTATRARDMHAGNTTAVLHASTSTVPLTCNTTDLSTTGTKNFKILGTTCPDTAVYPNRGYARGSSLGRVYTHNQEQLHVVTDKSRARYIERPLDEAKTEEREEFKKSFTEIQGQTLPESDINTPHPEFKDLANKMLQNKRRWKCLRELDKAVLKWYKVRVYPRPQDAARS